MPPRRRLAYRSRPRRGRRMMRRRLARRKPAAAPRVYHYKRSVFYENIVTVDNTVNYSNSWGFTLGMLPSASDFTNLYDEYCITKAVLKFIPKISQATLQSGVTTGNSLLTQIHTAIDYDDSNSLTNATALSEITQYQSHRMSRGNQTHTRVIVPKVEVTGSTGQYPKAYQWIDCDNTTVLHNGVKVVIPKLPVANTLLYYDAMITLYFKCRNVL